MIDVMSSPTSLKPQPHHGYKSWTTTWWDDQGHRRTRRFGKVGEVPRRIAAARYNDWLLGDYRNKAHVRNPDDPNLYTVGMLCADYEKHAATLYVKHGYETSQMDSVRAAMRALRTAHGDAPVESVGAPEIARLRDAMIDAKDRKGEPRTLAVSTVNGRLRIIRQAFAWGRLYGPVPAAVAYDVSLVKALKAGRTKAKAPVPVKPVPEGVLNRTLAEAPQTVADMARLQYWTGMRPGEVCQLRACDIDRKGDVWLYTPGTHKTEHHGKGRVVPIGPNAQKILRTYIAKRARITDYVFLPEEAHRERLEQLGYPEVMAYQLSRSAFKPGRMFRTETYYNKIRYACERVFDPKGTRRAKGDRSFYWHPHQLRHNAATRMRELAGLEDASHVLGHDSKTSTLIYAAQSVEKMKEVARIAG